MLAAVVDTAADPGLDLAADFGGSGGVAATLFSKIRCLASFWVEVEGLEDEADDDEAGGCCGLLPRFLDFDRFRRVPPVDGTPESFAAENGADLLATDAGAELDLVTLYFSAACSATRSSWSPVGI